MEALFSPKTGWLILAAYALMMLLLTALFARDGFTKTAFLVSDRRVGEWPAAFSIAATWIWAPALFLAAQKAYTQGLAGVFWFTVPNAACLVIFAWFAERIRTRLPEGFTLSGYIEERFSARTQALYLVQLGGLAACSFAVQLLAGGAVVAALTGIPFSLVTVALALIALSYSLFSGLRASVVTDYAQMILIAVVSLVLVPWAVHSAGGWGEVWAGLDGRSGTFGSLFSGDGGGVFWTFGIPVTIGLLAGPFGDQSFWQRAFAIREGQVKGAFVKGALIFAIVPVTMSLLGFLAAGKGLAIKDVQLVNLAAVLEWLPAWTAVPFTFMLLSGLVSTIDSNMCAVSSLAGHDLGGGVAGARVSMVLLTVLALVIANVPGMKILYLFLFYGTLRASTLLPTVLSLTMSRVAEAGLFWGILAAILVGLPVFAWGNFGGRPDIAVIGSLITVLTSGLVTVAASWAKPGASARAGGLHAA